MKTLCTLFVVLCLCGCNVDLPYENEYLRIESADDFEGEYIQFDIARFAEGMKSYGCPYYNVTIHNSGNIPAHGCQATIYAVDKGFNILDTGTALYMGEILPWQKITLNNLTFYNLTSHDDYYEIVWEFTAVE